MSCGATSVSIRNPRSCEALHMEFPASRKAIPAPMSRRKARSWPCARGAARSRRTEAKAAAVREKTVATTGLAPEPCGREAKTSAPAAQQIRATVGGKRGTRGSRSLPASEPCNLLPPELQPSHPIKLVPRLARPVGRVSCARVRPFDDGDQGGTAYGVQASWKHGADGLRVVPRVHDLRTGSRRRDLEGDRRPFPRGRRQLRGHRRRLLERHLGGDHRHGPE